MANVNVNLSFTADTSKAKSALQDLQNSLSSLIKQGGTSSASKLGITKQLTEASAAAAELKAHLQMATNVKTGNLDFTKLNDSLRASGTSLSEYGAKLQALGPQGQAAFSKLTQAVAMSEIPIKRANAGLQQFAITLKNTAKWQISSSILHGFIGAIQQAYGYAQDLNESLNNIRIVTGYSVDKMAQFAGEANKAARALSTTTTAYTDASLIYYQQGLNDSEVKERTDVTIKLANVARESATTVSDQMTAVWNNFDDGSKSLEYYADVITKLGAATAASNSEIAEGIEKFSAISKTVGLSYEYATSALTTVVDRTRQSADVVGTAFKTMFARIQGLKLGETLEDGTTLNQYSQALMSVGINIKNANGELKDMDVILDEMGSKWTTLNRDEQVALAQKVAGVRQYQQLISLMENYDFFKENVDLARNSRGALQEQADIYAESWEAAQKRVKAASQKIYSELLNDKVFINMLNNVEKLLSGIDKFIQSVGGLRGVLTTLGAVVTQVFQKQMVQGLQNAAHSMFMMTESGRKAAQQQQQNMVNSMMNQLYQGPGGIKTQAQEAEETGLREQLKLRQELINKSNEMSDVERMAAQTMMDAHREACQALTEHKQKEDELTESIQDTKFKFDEFAAEMAAKNNNNPGDIQAVFEVYKEEFEHFITAQKKIDGGLAVYDKLDAKIKTISENIKQSGEDFNIPEEELKELDAEIQKLHNEKLNELFKGLADNNDLDDVQEKLRLIKAEMENMQNKSLETFKANHELTKEQEAALDQYVSELTQLRVLKQQDADLESRRKNAYDATTVAMKAQTLSAQGMSQVLVSTFQSFNSLIASGQMLKGAWDTLTNPDISGFEKFLRVSMSLTMAIPMLITGVMNLRIAIKALRAEKTKDTLATGLEAAAEWLDTIAKKENTKESVKGAAASEANAKGARDDAAAMMEEAGAAEVDSEMLKKRNAELEQGAVLGGSGGKISKLGSAFKSFGTALKNVVIRFGGVAAGIAIAAAAATVGSKVWNSELEKVTQANKELEESQKALDTMMEDNSALNSKVDAYNNAQESLKGLVQGTTEYTNKLLENNQAAMELIQTYSDLQYNIGEGGLIIINEDSLKEVQKSQAEIARLQQLTVLERQNEVKQLKLQADLTKLNRKEIKGNTEEEFWKTGSKDEFVSSATGAGVGGGIGAAIGSLILPGVGTAIGAGIGMIAGTLGGQLYGNRNQETDYEKKAFSALAEAYKTQSNSIFADKDSIRKILADADINDGELVNSLYENRNSIESLIQQQISLEKSQSALTDVIWANVQAEHPEYGQDNTKYANAPGKYESDMVAGRNFSQEAAEANIDKYLNEEGQVTPDQLKKWNDWALDLFADAVTANAEQEYNNYKASSAAWDASHPTGKDEYGQTNPYAPIVKQYEKEFEAMEQRQSEAEAGWKNILDWAKKEFHTDQFTPNKKEGTFEYATTNEEDGSTTTKSITWQDLRDLYVKHEQNRTVEEEMAATQQVRDQFYTEFAKAFLPNQGKYQGKPEKETDEQAAKRIDANRELSMAQNIFDSMFDLFRKNNTDENGNFNLDIGNYSYDNVNNVREWLENNLGQLVSDEVARAYGFNTTSELMDTVQQNWVAYDKQWETIAEHNRDYLQDQHYSLNEALKLNKLATQNNPEAGVEQVAKLYEDITKDAKNDKERQLFFNIDFDKNATEEQIQRAFDYLQQEAEQKEIKVKLQATIDAEEALNNLDYKSLAEGFTHEGEEGEDSWSTQMSWGKNGIIEFEEFLSKSYDDQKDYLERIKMDQMAAIADHSAAMQQTLGDQLESYKSELEILKANLLEMQQMRSQIENGAATGDLETLDAQIQATTDRINTLNSALGETQTQMAEAETDIQNYINTLASANDIDSDTLEGVIRVFQNAYESLKDNEAAAADLAVSFIKMQKAADYAKEHMVDFTTVVTKAKNATTAGKKALLQMDTSWQKLRTTMADVLGVSEDLLTDEFMVDSFKDFQKGINGSTSAMNSFRASFLHLKTDLPEDELKNFLDLLDGLEDGHEVTIDAGSALDEFFKLQVAAATTEEDLKNRLSGIPVNMELEGYYDNLEAAQIAAASCGGYVAENMSMDAEVTPVQGKTTDTVQDVGFTESYEPAGIIPFTSQVLETVENGSTTTKDVTAYMQAVRKTVNFDVQEQPADKEQTVNAVHMEPGGDAPSNNVGKIPVYKPVKAITPSTCFVAGTLITTIDGIKPIEEIQVDDLVLSYNESTGQNEYNKVLQTMIHTTKEVIYKLFIENESIEVTGSHKILINRDFIFDWLQVKQIKINDQVLFADGTLHKIIDIQTDIRLETVYNFEVANTHNYYVGRNQFLAHNKGTTTCFEAGTLISTINGFKKIENIQIGDIVLSYNEQKKINEYSKVLQTMIHTQKDIIYSLYINNEILRVTGIHRFYILRNGIQDWIHAKDLKIGDQVLFANGKLCQIDNILSEFKLETVYNFEVANNHNYYVGQNQILAHNKSSCFEAGTLISTETGFKNIEDIEVGDIVLSYNYADNKNEYSKVLQTMIHNVKEKIYELYIEDDILYVTGVHKFLVVKDDYMNWVPVSQININDYVLFANGTLHKVFNIKSQIKITTVYNFEVANNHNYYVGQNQILAHNKGGGCFEAGTLITKGSSFEKIENIKIGDIVLSYNEQTGKNEYSKVLQTMIHILRDNIYTLYIGHEILKVTGIHKFLINRNGNQKWIPASELQLTDFVLFANGTWHKIQNIEVEEKFIVVYNFEVENNHNYYVGYNQILAHNKGGSTTKPAKKERAPKRTDTVDRYKEINDKLKVVNRNLDKYNTLTDAAYGKNKLKGMQQILEAYRDQIKLQQKLIKEAENYAKIDKQNLEDAAKELKVTLKYDEDGNVSNIESVQNSMADKIDSLYAKYNSFSTAEEQSTFKEETMEPYTEQVSHFKDMLSQYEETLDKIAEAKQEKLNLSIEQMNKRLEAKKYKIQLRFDVREREINLFTRELTKLEKAAFTTGRQLALMNAQVRATKDESTALTKGVRDLLANGIYKEVDGKVKTLKQIYKNDKAGLKAILNDLMETGGSDKFWEEWKINADTIEDLNEYADKALDLSDSLDEVIEKMTNMIPNIYDRILEKTDKLVSKMDTLINRYSTWMEIIELLGKEWLFKNGDGGYDDSFMKILRANSNQNAIDQVKGARASENLAVTAWEAGVKNQPTQEKVIDDQIDNLKDERTNALKDTELYASKKRWNKKHPGKEMTGYQYRDWLEDTYLPAREKERKDWADRIKELEDKGKKRTNAETKELSQLYKKTEKSLEKSKKASEWIAEWDQVLDTYDSKIQQQEQKKTDIANNVQDLENQMEEAKNFTVETLMEALQTIIENAASTLQDVRKQYEDLMADGYHNIQDMQDAMARNKKISEQYLGDYEKVYELTKLNRDLEKKMDETTNLKTKQQLAEYQKKILDYAREGVKMSKYDLEYMQKEYDLEVAKIALEEAQNAKTQVRLTRDAEGNYSYTYTADESKTAEAQQTYENKLNEIVKLSNDYQEQMLESELALKQERLDSLAELDEALARHQITEQEYGEKVAALEKYYTEQSVYFARERDNAARNNTYVLMNELAPYYDITEKKIGISNKFNETEVKNFNAAKERLEQARRDREASLTEIENQLAAGKISAEKYEAKLAEINSKYTKETAAAETMIKTTMTNIEQNMDGVTTYAEDKFLPEYSDTWRSASELNQEFEEKFELWRTGVKGVLDGSEQDLKDTVKAAGISLDESKDMWEQVGLYIAKENKNIRDEISSTEKGLENAVDNGQDELTEASNDLDTQWKKTYPILTAAQTALQTVADKILGIQTAAAGLDTITVNTDTAEAEANLNSIIKKLNAIKKKQKALETNSGGKGDPNDGDDDTGGGKGGTGGGNTGLTDKQKLTIAKKIAASIWGGKGAGNWETGHNREQKINQVFGNKAYNYIQPLITKWIKSGEINSIVDQYLKYDWSWDKMKQYAGSDKYKFDTGGYTGVWGLDGRWALLHQKELVLNAKDTENMLAAVKTVREIAAMVDLQAQNASLAGQYALAIGQLTGARNAQSLDQNVHITAEFPNVQDHNEIEMALTSLVNRASQYAWHN